MTETIMAFSKPLPPRDRKQAYVEKDIKMTRDLVVWCCNCDSHRRLRGIECVECSHDSTECGECLFFRQDKTEAMRKQLSGLLNHNIQSYDETAER